MIHFDLNWAVSYSFGFVVPDSLTEDTAFSTLDRKNNCDILNDIWSDEQQ